MNVRIEWIHPSGLTIEFGQSDTDQFFLVNIEGLGSSRITQQTFRTPGQYGETLVDLLSHPRTIAISAWIMADTVEDVWTLREVLSSALTIVPLIEAPTITLGRLRFHLPSGAIRELYCTPVDSPQDTFLGETTIGVDVEFFAPYPYYLDPEDYTIDVVRAGSFAFPVQFPFQVDIAGGAELPTIHNVGSVDVPVRMEIYGEVANPRITNITTGKTLEILNTIPAGSYVVVETEYGRKSVTLMPAGTNWIQYVQLAASDFWWIRPGDNDIEFEATTMGSGARLNLRWRPAWSGI